MCQVERHALFEMRETILKNRDNRQKVQAGKKWQHNFWQSYLDKQLRNTCFDLWSHFPNSNSFSFFFQFFCCNLQLIHQLPPFCSCPPPCISFSDNSLHICTTFFGLVVTLTDFPVQLTYRCFHCFDLLQNFSNLFRKPFFRFFLFR